MKKIAEIRILRDEYDHEQYRVEVDTRGQSPTLIEFASGICQAIQNISETHNIPFDMIVKIGKDVIGVKDEKIKGLN